MIEEKLSMEDVMKQMDSLKQKEDSKVIKGTVIEIDSAAGKVLVDIGYKSEGIISLEEFSDKEINIGDEVDVFIVKKSRDFESPPILSHKRAELEQQWDKLQEAKTNDFVLDVKIEKKVKGGLIVDINGIMAFMPASLAGYPMVKNLDSILGNTVPCKVIEFDRDKRNVVVSWRKAIEEDVLRKREELFEQLYPGKMVKGVISGIKSFGAFVDIGGLDGLLHISELSWGHVDKVEDILEIGQEVEVKIKSFNPNSNKVSLSLKETQPHPWENIDSKYVVGDIVKGKVTGVANYGAFVELSPGIEGLVKTEELSWTDNVKHAGDVLKVTDIVEVKILALDKENQRMALSLKQAKQNPWEEVESNYQQGNIIEGSITHITDFGAFMMLKEGVEGLIHISDMSWTRNIKHPDEVVKVGDTVKVKIMSIEPDKQKISLGLKQVEENPYADYPVGSIIDEAKITKVSANGAYLELKNSLTAFLHISNYSKERTDNLQNHLAEGDTLKCKVIKNNPAKKYIEVSIKDYLKDKEKADTQKYIQPSGTTGGATIYDLIGDKLDGITEEKE